MAQYLDTHYSLDYQLGKGASGAVFAANRKSDGLKVAVKIIPRSKVPDNRLAIESDSSSGICVAIPMEVYILRRLSHPNIIQLIDYFEDEHYFYIITELHGNDTDFCSINKSHSSNSCKPTDLFECIEKVGPLPEKVALYVFNQIVKVLSYLKSMNVYHLDLKDENIVIDSNYHVKLIDFGSAHIVADHRLKFTKFFGTLEYAPPEVLRGQSYVPEKADVWALGTLLYTMLYQQPPFASSHDVISGKLSTRKRNVHVSEKVQQLLTKMLQSNDKLRINLSDIRNQK